MDMVFIIPLKFVSINFDTRCPEDQHAARTRTKRKFQGTTRAATLNLAIKQLAINCWRPEEHTDITFVYLASWMAQVQIG